jgi:hypothetical protein
MFPTREAKARVIVSESEVSPLKFRSPSPEEIACAATPEIYERPVRSRKPSREATDFAVQSKKLPRTKSGSGEEDDGKI